MTKKVHAADVWDRLPPELRARLAPLVDDPEHAAELSAILETVAEKINEGVYAIEARDAAGAPADENGDA